MWDSHNCPESQSRHGPWPLYPLQRQLLHKHPAPMPVGAGLGWPQSFGSSHVAQAECVLPGLGDGGELLPVCGEEQGSARWQAALVEGRAGHGAAGGLGQTEVAHLAPSTVVLNFVRVQVPLS